MTYGINIQPYNDPYIKIAEEAMKVSAELLILGAFLVDIIPILKYVPVWFPGAKFQRKAIVMREHADIIRNKTYAATEELMVCVIHHFSRILMRRARFQASSDYDPSFVTEVLLKEIQHSKTPKQDISLLKDVAFMAYLG